jgi:peptide/nickel transport system substrate-binding protein
MDKNDTPLEALVDPQTRRSALKAIGALGVGGFAGLAGCTGGGEDTPTVTDADSGGDTPTATPMATPTDGDGDQSSDQQATFRINAVQRFGTIDPAKGTDYTQTMANVNLYDPLVFPTPEGKIRPHLAEDWSVSSDNRSFTFTLRDATFHSGNPVRAEDVQFSIERLLDINQGWSSQFVDIIDKENVTVESEKEVTFTLNRVFSPFLAALVLLFIVDKKAVLENSQDGEFGDRGDYGQQFLTNNDAGSGPFTLKDFERGSFITWEKYDDYWMEFPENAFDVVRVNIITEDPTVRSLMKTGELSMTSQYQSPETYQQLGEENGVYVNEVPTATMFYFKINTQKPPVDDIEVRRAMAWGFDYETVRTEINPGQQKALGPLPEVFAAHNSDLVQPTYDPQKARQILSDAGYADGELTITNTYVEGFSVEENMGLLFQDNMDEIGIEVELKPQTWGTMTELATSVEDTPHTNQVFFGPIKPHPDSFFFNQYHSEAAKTWMRMEHLNDDQVDEMITEARETADQDAQTQIYRDLQERIANLYPDLFVFNQVKKHGFQNNVQGYTYRPAQSFDYWYHDFHQG